MDKAGMEVQAGKRWIPWEFWVLSPRVMMSGAIGHRNRERSVVDVDCRLSPGEFDPVWHSQTSSAVKAVESDAPRLS